MGPVCKMPAQGYSSIFASLRKLWTIDSIGQPMPGRLTAAVDHAYAMAESARVWAERASSIVDVSWSQAGGVTKRTIETVQMDNFFKA